MYEIKFTTVTGSDWAERIECINDETGAALTDVDTGTIELQVQDRNSCVMFTLTTADSTITRPASGAFQWRRATADLSSLCKGTTYRVGCRHIDGSGATSALFTGSLAYLDGEFEWQ